jgi:twitching motility protein PilT
MALSIDDLLRRAVETKASDLHLKVGNHPCLRVDGSLTPLTDVPRVTPEEMLSMAFSMMTNRQKQKFKETAELDMAYGVAGLGRFRHGPARHSHQDSHDRGTESATRH